MPQIRKILVPVDFSAPSTRAFQHALGMAEKFGSAVHVLHAWEIPTYLRPDLTVWAGEVSATLADHAAREAATGMAEFLKATASGPNVTSAVVAGPAYLTILAAAKEGNFDLIVMGTHGHTGLTHLVLGSVTERIVRHADCPVLTVRSTHS